MPDSLEVMKANFGNPEYRVTLGEISCKKCDFASIDEIKRFGLAIRNAEYLVSLDSFLTEEKNGHRNLVCGHVDRKFNSAIINIDIEDNINVLSSHLFERMTKYGYGFEVTIEGMDNITQKDRARGGFWCVFSPI